MDINVSSFQLKDNLNPKIWDNDQSLNSRVRQHLEKIAKVFITKTKIPTGVISDIILTGSLAGYNWSNYSDVDLHVIVDYSKIKGNKELIKKLFDNERKLWNEHHEIKMFEYTVEVYVQDKIEHHVSAGTYSILEDRWLSKPEKENFVINKEEIKRKAISFAKKIISLEKEVSQETINLDKLETKAANLKDKIKNMRAAGLEKGGELSIENLVFKALRRNGFLEKLINIKTDALDKNLSLSEIKF